jgi:hypothetical protein
MCPETRAFSRPRPLALLAAAGILIGFAGVHGTGNAPAERLLITGARVLDVRAGRYLSPTAVLIDGDRITALSAQPPSSVPPDARRIDLPGATLVPGMGDMFAAAAPSPEADADFYYSMALAYGVTMYRAVNVPAPWGSAQRSRVAAGDLVAPRLWVSGPGLDQQAAFSFALRRTPDAASARRAVAEQAAARVDWVAALGGTSPDVYRAIVQAGHAARLRVSGEPGATSTIDLSRLGVDAVTRLGSLAKPRADLEKALQALPDYPRNDPQAAADYAWEHVSAADVQAAASQLARRQTTVVPLLASFAGTVGADEVKQDPAVQALPARWREELVGRAHPAGWPGGARAARAAEARGRAVLAIVKAGGRVTTGLDVESGYSVPGAGIHRELALLVAAGLTPIQAIRAATVNCAEMLGAAATLGQVRAGFKADLVAVDGDPLQRIEDLQRIRLIVRGGEVLDRDELLAQARRAGR